MKPDIDRDKATKGQDKGENNDPHYLGRAWEAVKESVGADRWTDAQESDDEKVE